MSTKVRLDHGGTDIGSWDDDGPRPRGCRWEESVCTDTPTHSLEVPAGERTEYDTYCARHYALTLVKLVQHVSTCQSSARDHLVSYGPMTGDRKTL